MSSSQDVGTRFFTGRQVTTMVVALMATVVLLPSAVWAVDTFSNVAIMDPVSGVKAKVDNARRLNVSDGGGHMTVDGTVVAQAAPPSELRRFFASVPAWPSCGLVAAPASGKALILSTVNVGFAHAPAELNWLSLRIATPSEPCSGFLQWVVKYGDGMETVDLGSGLVIPAGKGLYARKYSSFSATIAAYGYQVPASAVPATASAAETSEPSGPPPRP